MYPNSFEDFLRMLFESFRRGGFDNLVNPPSFRRPQGIPDYTTTTSMPMLPDLFGGRRPRRESGGVTPLPGISPQPRRGFSQPISRGPSQRQPGGVTPLPGIIEGSNPERRARMRNPNDAPFTTLPINNPPNPRTIGDMQKRAYNERRRMNSENGGPTIGLPVIR